MARRRHTPGKQTGCLVQPLKQVPLGSTVRIVRVDQEDPTRLIRLSSLGLVPGTTIRLRQRWPALILGIGESVLALDSDLGSEIHVQRIPLEVSSCTKSR